MLISNSIGRENLSETIYMLSHSPPVQWLLLATILSSGICNIAGAFITKYLSSVHNAIVSELRVVLVWVPNIIRYFLDKKNAQAEDRSVKGEPLDWFSILKVIGFATLITGAYVYNGNIKLPFYRLYPANSDTLQNPQIPEERKIYQVTSDV